MVTRETPVASATIALPCGSDRNRFGGHPYPATLFGQEWIDESEAALYS